MRILCLLAIVMFAAHAADVNSLLAAARSAQRAGDFASAEDAFNAAFELALTKNIKRLSPVAIEVANFYSQRQQPEKAEIVLKRAFDAEESASEPPAMEIPALTQLEGLYQLKRRYVDLVPVETRLVKAWEIVAGSESAVVANSLYHLGGTLEQAGQFAEAEQAIQQAIAIFEKDYGSDSPPVGLALGRLASIDNRLGKGDLAAEARKRESAIRQRIPAQSASRIGAGISAPRPISKQEPKYSERARKKKIQGTVILSLIVDAKGEPADITVMLPLGEGLDENAVDAVSTWRFQPGMKNGQPVAVHATIEVNFRLL